MIAAIGLFLLQDEPPARTPAIYRVPAKLVRLDRLEAMMGDDPFDSYCIEPALTAEMKAILVKGKVKIVDPKSIDTKANLAWRNATIEYAAGRISPKEWLKRTKILKTTAHFLTSPKTKALRETLGPESYKSTFAEMLVLCWKGRPCLTSTDVWQAVWWPENDDRMQSWILAMNDHLGPMLYLRSKWPKMFNSEPKIISAPDRPGLFVFSLTQGPSTKTFYFNNSDKPVRLPTLDPDQIGMSRGLIAGDDHDELSKWGSLEMHTGPDR